ncbi:hypothetical protein I5Q34_26720 [Streptomyces sp. AV19]|uniref:hypothetical protein n=1 Tax=Streptomyces sp. AV19 TaxID=2793068 RepID=UPI0018FE5C4A|nr:hypothetical protein [Streptomyces sp. AV19]MBH1937821.1 hypothetical protein [Streptomyces sp. AV19]MDG4537099.1 hypothetical protein [Streptomyces sp. AV19]
MMRNLRNKILKALTVRGGQRDHALQEAHNPCDDTKSMLDTYAGTVDIYENLLAERDETIRSLHRELAQARQASHAIADLLTKPGTVPADAVSDTARILVRHAHVLGLEPHPLRQGTAHGCTHEEGRMTPAQFRSRHGDCTAWTLADYESYEHLVEGTDPDIARAAREGRVIIGRRADGDRVVVDLAG